MTLTGVGARNEPQAAVLLRGVLQRDPEAHHPAQRLRVQKRGILVWRHCSKRRWLGAWKAPGTQHHEDGALGALGLDLPCPPTHHTR